MRSYMDIPVSARVWYDSTRSKPPSIYGRTNSAIGCFCSRPNDNPSDFILDSSGEVPVCFLARKSSTSCSEDVVRTNESSTSSSGHRYSPDDDGEDKDSSKPMSVVLVFSSSVIVGTSLTSLMTSFLRCGQQRRQDLKFSPENNSIFVVNVAIVCPCFLSNDRRGG